MDLSIIGKIIELQNPNSDNPLTTEIPGWHVNSTQEIAGLEQFQVYPEKPYRLFSGVDTFFYVFPNESDWQVIAAQHPELAPLVGNHQ